jgi:hypothetical protein
LVLLKSVTEFWRRGSRSARRRKFRFVRSKLSDHDALAKTRRSTDPGREMCVQMIWAGTFAARGARPASPQNLRRRPHFCLFYQFPHPIPPFLY